MAITVRNFLIKFKEDKEYRDKITKSMKKIKSNWTHISTEECSVINAKIITYKKND